MGADYLVHAASDSFGSYGSGNYVIKDMEEVYDAF
jgi:hypothetical protein